MCAVQVTAAAAFLRPGFEVDILQSALTGVYCPEGPRYSDGGHFPQIMMVIPTRETLQSPI